MTAFEKPVFELIEFNANDIITSSVEPGGDCQDNCIKGVCTNKSWTQQ